MEEEEEVRVGSLVWVRRKNGIWWPGRVMGPSDISLSHQHFTFAPRRAKIMLLGRDNAPMDWYNLESSKRIKAFRCGEFDDCIRKAESTNTLASTKNLKYARRHNAILHALELERQQAQKNLKRPGSDMQQESCSRAKRSKRVYFSLESRDIMEQSVKSASSTKNTSDPMKSYSSESGNEVEMRTSKAASDIYMKQHKNNRKIQGGIRYSSESSVDDKTLGSPDMLKSCKPKRKLSIQQVCRRPVGPDDDRSCVLDYKGDTKPREKNECHFGDTKETLIDVHVDVLASYRAVHVPLVSMMSRVNGKAIIGHPVNIESLEGTSETRVLNKNVGGKFYQLAWKTSKRTLVSYSPLPLTCEDTKKQQISNRSRKVFHATKDGKSKGESELPCVACVPVKHIFGKLQAAVSTASQNH